MWSLIFVLVTASPEGKAFTSPASAAPEYGHAVSSDEALEGWIALFDGKTTFGWDGAEVNSGNIARGKTTSVFGACDLQGDATDAGELAIGEEVVKIASGKFRVTV